MKRCGMVFTVCGIAVFLLMSVLPAQALDDAQVQELGHARKLLFEEKVLDAMNIFKKLNGEEPDEFEVRLGLIDATIEQARMLKEKKDKNWEAKIYTAYNDLKGIFRAHSTSPEIYLSFAKAYALNNRFQKAKRSLEKAFYFRPGFAEGLIIQGDIYFDRAKEKENDTFNEDAEQEAYRARRFAIKSYEDALNSAGLNPETRAMISYKLGDVYNHFRQRDKAKEHWSNAVQSSSEGYWVSKSRDELAALN